jgi:hypothetical protein
MIAEVPLNPSERYQIDDGHWGMRQHSDADHGGQMVAQKGASGAMQVGTIVP